MSKLLIQTKYGIAPNNLLYKKGLSLKAKGLFVYMQSKPNGWNFSAVRIALECKESRGSIQLVLKELEEHGYLTRSRKKNSKGHWEWTHTLCENPEHGFRALEKPALENPPLKQEVISKQYKVRRKETSEQSSHGLNVHTYSQLGAEVLKAFEEVNPACKRMYGHAVQRVACDFLIEDYGLEQVKTYIAFLPKTNVTKYFPRIYTPVQLRDKWQQLEDALVSKTLEGKIEVI